MYGQLPFDRAETVDKLGTKLFTRIKKDEEQAVIRAFLAMKGDDYHRGTEMQSGRRILFSSVLLCRLSSL